MRSLLPWAPAAPVWFVVGLSIALGLSVGLSKKAQAASWTPFVALILLLVGLWFCRFDGDARPGRFIDGTSFAWMYCIVARIPMGFALMVLGPLIARVAVDFVGEQRAVLAGALASFPLATGLTVAGAVYLNAARRTWDHGLSSLPREHFVGNALLMVGAGLSFVIAMVFVIALINRPQLDAPSSF
ncbi:MAG: hypothetical protein AB8H86_09730 [Polyangiales bacterium]